MTPEAENSFDGDLESVVGHGERTVVNVEKMSPFGPFALHRTMRTTCWRVRDLLYAMTCFNES
jgi:hypothetical protein